MCNGTPHTEGEGLKDKQLEKSKESNFKAELEAVGVPEKEVDDLVENKTPMLSQSEVACTTPIEDVLRYENVDPFRGLSDGDIQIRMNHLCEKDENKPPPQRSLIRQVLFQEKVIDRSVTGFNDFNNDQEDESLILNFLDKFKDPLIGLLCLSVFVSLVIGQYDDAISITLAVLIVVTVGFVQEYRSEQSLKELKRLVPHRCHCYRNGIKIDIEASHLVVGDIVHVSVGDRVPADVRFINTQNLEIDESSLTGESSTIKKNADVIAKDQHGIELSQRKNIGFMGTLVRHGHGKAMVVAIGSDTEIGKVFSMMSEVEDKKTPLQLKMDELGGQLTMLSFAIIAVIGLLGLFQGKSILEIFTVGVSLAVAAIPEGLPIVVTVTLALGVIRMAKQNVIIKKLPCVESLGAAHVICSDKTGTLTKNEMTVVHLYTPEHGGITIEGAGYSTKGSLLVDQRQVQGGSHPAITRVVEAGVLCNNSQLVSPDQKSDKAILGQPTEAALLVLAAKCSFPDFRDNYTRLEEMPFNSETKWMAVKCHYDPTSLSNSVLGMDTRSLEDFNRDDVRPKFYVKGMVDAVLNMCTSMHLNSDPHKRMDFQEKEKIQNMASDIASSGLRVLAIASGADMSSLTFLGLVGMYDPPRDGIIESIKLLKESHIQVAMITGDAKETAIKIAESVGIFDRREDRVLSGKELETMPREALAMAVSKTTVFYRTTPRAKLDIINALQDCDKVVAMTGDGVNDAPALKQANIGIAMGSGTDVCKEAADMILVDDDFSTLVVAVEEGKNIFGNIQNFVRFQLSTSLAALGLVTLTTLLGFPNPLNAMQILWINIIMDGPPAQSLGVEPVVHGTLKTPPRKISAPVITKDLMRKIVFSAILIIFGTLCMFYSELQEDYAITDRATTMAFTTFVMFDMFNALACRSLTQSILKLGFFSNKMFLYAVGGSIFGQILVVYFAPFQSIFQTESLSVYDLCCIIALTSSVFILDELRKRRLNNTKNSTKRILP